jgi:hypothetical protein
VRRTAAFPPGSPPRPRDGSLLRLGQCGCGERELGVTDRERRELLLPGNLPRSPIASPRVLRHRAVATSPQAPGLGAPCRPDPSRLRQCASRLVADPGGGGVR